MSNADPVLQSSRALRALADEIDQLASHVGDARESRPELSDLLDAVAGRFSRSTLGVIDDLRELAQLELRVVYSALRSPGRPFDAPTTSLDLGRFLRKEACRADALTSEIRAAGSEADFVEKHVRDSVEELARELADVLQRARDYLGG